MLVQRFGRWQFLLDEGLRAGSWHSDGSTIVEIVDVEGRVGGGSVETIVLRNGKIYKIWGISKLKPIEITIDEKLRKIYVKYKNKDKKL